MHNALHTLGITTDGKLPLEVILSETFNGRLYGLDEDQMERVRALRDIVSEYGKPSAPPTVIRESSDVASLLHHDMKNLGHEEVWAVFLNASNTVISRERIFVGSVNAVSFSPKDILSKALCANATGIIMVHNHPSGNPRPSIEDVRQTEALRNAASTLGISLVDHVIIAKGSFYSFADERESRIG